MSQQQNKWYIVWAGKEPGIYKSWQECRAQVEGVKGARYKSYKEISYAEAQKIYDEGAPARATTRKTSRTPKTPAPKEVPVIEQGSIAVDAACSGNPGKMEYQGVDIGCGATLFASKVYPKGTNNIGEFLAIVHAMAWMLKHNYIQTIYTDSRTALSWIRQKKCKSKLQRTADTEELWQVIERAEAFLQRHPIKDFKIIKWDTDRYGEIPADYGRK